MSALGTAQRRPGNRCQRYNTKAQRAGPNPACDCHMPHSIGSPRWGRQINFHDRSPGRRCADLGLIQLLEYRRLAGHRLARSRAFPRSGPSPDIYVGVCGTTAHRVVRPVYGASLFEGLSPSARSLVNEAQPVHCAATIPRAEARGYYRTSLRRSVPATPNLEVVNNREVI